MHQRPRVTRGDHGASAVEYGLLIAAIAAVIVLAVFAVGRATQASYDETCQQFENNTTAAIKADTDCP